MAKGKVKMWAVVDSPIGKEGDDKRYLFAYEEHEMPKDEARALYEEGRAEYVEEEDREAADKEIAKESDERVKSMNLNELNEGRFVPDIPAAEANSRPATGVRGDEQGHPASRGLDASGSAKGSK